MISDIEHGGPVVHCQVGKAQRDEDGLAHNTHGLQSSEGRMHQPRKEDKPLTAANQLCDKGEPDSPRGPQGPGGGDPLGGGTPFGGGRAEFSVCAGCHVGEAAANIPSLSTEGPRT